MDAIRQDLRQAIRSLRRSPGFALAVVATLALGIGGNTAIFSVVNAVLLRPLPFPQPDRLVTVWGYHPDIGRETASLPDFLDWRRDARSFERMAAWATTQLTLTGAGEPEVVRGAQVTADYFRVLDVPVPIGRGFESADERSGGARVAVLGYGFWQRRFGGDPGTVGRRIVLGGLPFTVVGVGARGLALPEDVEVWTPLTTDTTLGRRNDFLQIVGRLAPGATLGGAQQEMATIARRLERDYPGSNAGWGVQLLPLRERIVGDIRPALVVFMGAVAAVLLIACANVANLMLVRAASREREVTVRAALGASRPRLVRQLLTESLVLAVAGGVAGVGLAVWGVQALRSLEPGTIPRLREIAVDGRALAFALTLSVLVGVASGLMPSRRILRYDLRGGLSEGGRTQAGGREAGRARALLVLAEVALACVLLVGAALLLRSFDRLQRVDPGFTGRGVLTARLTLPLARYGTPERQAAFTEPLLARLQALPGVASAALTTDAPIGDGLPYLSFEIAGGPPRPPDAVQDAVVFRTSPDYFRTLGIPVVRGRLFDARDRADAAPVVLVNQTLARRYWPDRNPVGARITLDNPTDSAAVWMTIVGVAGDVRQETPASQPYPQLYVPLAQLSARSFLIAMRTRGDPLQQVAALRRAVAGLDPDLALTRVATMDERVAATLARPRVNAAMLGAFALTALLLAGLGIYGTIAYGVTQRTRELGIRMALGARAGDVLRLVIRQGMAPVFGGLGLGLVAAAAGSRVLHGLLYGIGRTDPSTYAAVAGFLSVVALAASWLPARRAAQADPVAALRMD